MILVLNKGLLMIKLEEIHFHDSEILKVTSNSEKGEVCYLLSYPVDWENNIYENRTLRFFGVTQHEVQEGAIVGNPTLLDVKIDKVGDKTKLQFGTTAGQRNIEFVSFTFL